MSWSNPGDSSITGYEYQYRYAGVGWSAWISVADSDASTTSFTRSGLDAGTEYRFKARVVNSAGASKPGPTADPWFVAATTSPGAPTSVTVTRSDGAITASWPAVSGADGYNVTYSAVGNVKWIAAAANHNRTSITISGVNNDHTYLVGASAQNGAGASAQTVSPAAGPYSNKAPAAPPSVTILRGNGTMTAFWNSGYGAETYEVAYTADGGGTWTTAAASLPVGNGTTSIDISGLDNANTYTVRVRARNKNGRSEWRNSRPNGPYNPPNAPPKPRNVEVYPSDKAATFIWDKPVDLEKQNTDVTGYQAAYWENPGNCAWPAAVKWYNIYGSDGDTVYHTVLRLENGKKFGVALRALNQNVAGPRVGACLTPQAGVKPPPALPPAPESLNVIRGDGTLTATWHHSWSATGYQVDYSSDGGKNWKMGAFWNNTTSVILKGMDNNAEYTVRVRGRNDRGDGPWTSLSVLGLRQPDTLRMMSNHAGQNYSYTLHWERPPSTNTAIAFS